jgi:hypothetical protein
MKEDSVIDGQSGAELDAQATKTLEQARAMPPGPDRIEAMKRAGALRAAADKLAVSSSPAEAVLAVELHAGAAIRCRTHRLAGEQASRARSASRSSNDSSWIALRWSHLAS